MNEEYWENRRVLVTGGSGFLGSALTPYLRSLGAHVRGLSSSDGDLRDADVVRRIISESGCEVLVHLAASVGGLARLQKSQLDMYADNVLMTLNLFRAARTSDVERVLFVGSSNMYGTQCRPPYEESEVWNGRAHDSIVGYGMAKRAGLIHGELLQNDSSIDTISVILDNVYGPGDCFDIRWARVIPANIRRICEAVKRKEDKISVWGSPDTVRDFVYIEDAARSLAFFGARADQLNVVNVANGNPIRMHEMIETISSLIGFQGQVAWDSEKPTGRAERYLNVDQMLECGFVPALDLEEGLNRTIRYFVEEVVDSS